MASKPTTVAGWIDHIKKEVAKLELDYSLSMRKTQFSPFFANYLHKPPFEIKTVEGDSAMLEVEYQWGASSLARGARAVASLVWKSADYDSPGHYVAFIANFYLILLAQRNDLWGAMNGHPRCFFLSDIKLSNEEEFAVSVKAVAPRPGDKDKIIIVGVLPHKSVLYAYVAVIHLPPHPEIGNFTSATTIIVRTRKDGPGQQDVINHVAAAMERAKDSLSKHKEWAEVKISTDSTVVLYEDTNLTSKNPLTDDMAVILEYADRCSRSPGQYIPPVIINATAIEELKHASRVAVYLEEIPIVLPETVYYNRERKQTLNGFDARSIPLESGMLDADRIAACFQLMQGIIPPMEVKSAAELRLEEVVSALEEPATADQEYEEEQHGDTDEESSAELEEVLLEHNSDDDELSAELEDALLEEDQDDLDAILEEAL